MGSTSPPRESSKLFTPLRLGIKSQASTTKGGLLITESMQPSFMGGGFYGILDMFAPEHVRAWKKVTDAVRTQGAFMACQWWHPLSSSATNIGYFKRNTRGGIEYPYKTAKLIRMKDIKDMINNHVYAAKCAIKARFDCTSDNGYLLDQFLNTNTNLLLDAVIAAVGASRVSIRMSPWETVWLPLDTDPITNFRYAPREVEKRGVAYVCLTQPRADLLLEEKTKTENMYAAIREGKVAATVQDLHLRHFFEVLKTTPVLTNGDYNGENCFEEVDRNEVDGITFARWFTSNPDLVEKLRLGKRLTKWNMETVYRGTVEAGSENVGYTDYPFGVVEEDAGI
ncbi:hypothetical protein BJX99DRAFT_245039 [Aspergillus californicus]